MNIGEESSLPRALPDIAGLTQILGDATRILTWSRQQAQTLGRRAYMDGHAAGFARAQAEAVRQVLDAQVKAREFVDASHERVLAMALASVQRMASTLGPATVVTALLADALEKLQAERQIRVNVHHSAVKATREMLARWQSEHPKIVVEVLVDPRLEPFDCEIESELGRIKLGLRKQLEATRDELMGAAEATIEITMTEPPAESFSY